MSWSTRFVFAVTSSQEPINGFRFREWVLHNKESLQKLISEFYQFDPTKSRINTTAVRIAMPSDLKRVKDSEETVFPKADAKTHQYFVSMSIPRAGKHTLTFLKNALQEYIGDKLLHLHGSMEADYRITREFLGDDLYTTIVWNPDMLQQRSDAISSQELTLMLLQNLQDQQSQPIKESTQVETGMDLSA